MSNTPNFPKLYYYDINRRIYTMNGVERLSPYEEGYYREIVIVSETEKEYICTIGRINKQNMMYKVGRVTVSTYTEQEKNDAVFIAENAHLIARRIMDIDAKTLREVEAVLLKNISK